MHMRRDTRISPNMQMPYYYDQACLGHDPASRRSGQAPSMVSIYEQAFVDARKAKCTLEELIGLHTGLGVS